MERLNEKSNGAGSDEVLTPTQILEGTEWSFLLATMPTKARIHRQEGKTSCEITVPGDWGSSLVKRYSDRPGLTCIFMYYVTNPKTSEVSSVFHFVMKRTTTN